MKRIQRKLMFNDCLYISYTTATRLHQIFSVKNSKSQVKYYKIDLHCIHYLEMVVLRVFLSSYNSAIVE